MWLCLLLLASRKSVKFTMKPWQLWQFICACVPVCVCMFVWRHFLWYDLAVKACQMAKLGRCTLPPQQPAFCRSILCICSHRDLQSRPCLWVLLNTFQRSYHSKFLLHNLRISSMKSLSLFWRPLGLPDLKDLLVSSVSSVAVSFTAYTWLSFSYSVYRVIGIC